MKGGNQMDIITVNNFAKSYGDFRAVRGISFSVEEGSLFAFLGPNGAGKSTTIEALTTLTAFDSGEVIINGHRLGKEDHEIRKSIGVVYQQGVLDHQLTVAENLWIRGSLYGFSRSELKRRIDEVVEITNIGELLKKRYARMSGGQQRRVDIARALIHTPKILFLDEPSTGVDAQTRKSIWEMIRNTQKEKGMTVFLTTHYMEEAKDAGKIVIIAHGEIIDQGTPFELKEKYTSTHVLLYGTDPALLDELRKEGLEAGQTDAYIKVTMDKKEDIIAFLQKYQSRFESFEVEMGTMDDMFIDLVEREEKGK